jgi:hypothetical protein
MTLDTILAVGFGILDVVLVIYELIQRSRIKAKEGAWRRDMEGIVNSITQLRNRIDNNEIQDIKEVRGGLLVLGNNAHSILAGIKDEMEKT